MPDYARGESITLTANYTNAAGTPILSGISGNTIDVYYYGSGGARTYYVNASGMSQDAVDLNRYYYYWTIPTDAIVTSTIAVYNAMFSGLSIQSTETFGIYQSDSSGTYIGSIAVSGYIIDISGTGIQNASIQASYLTGGNVLTSTVSDVNGSYTLYLNPDDYLLIASAQYYMSNSTSATVTSGSTVFSDITLLASSNGGAVSFTDTYLYTDPNNGAQSPLPNLKVTLYQSVSSPVLTTPLASTRTDSSGTFVFTANNGDYVLKIEGNGPNNTVFDTAYDIEVSDAFAGGTPEGFRYKGTSQYGFI